MALPYKRCTISWGPDSRLQPTPTHSVNTEEQNIAQLHVKHLHGILPYLASELCPHHFFLLFSCSDEAGVRPAGAEVVVE